MMCDKIFFLKNAISFFFSNRIQNGFHQSEGLIFLDLIYIALFNHIMVRQNAILKFNAILKKYRTFKFKIDVKFPKKLSKSLDRRNFFKFFRVKN